MYVGGGWPGGGGGRVMFVLSATKFTAIIAGYPEPLLESILRNNQDVRYDDK